jgi:REP element-mobilizing transposase RayT
MNILNSKIQGRKSFRLRDFDYAQDGLYFLTINCHNRRSLFGEIQLNKHEKFKVEMQLSDAGKIANQCWLDIPNHFPNVILHDYIIMPNHIHGIIELNKKVGVENIQPCNNENIQPRNNENLQPRRNEFQKIIPGSIGSIVRGFKIGVTKWMRQNTDIHDVWQRNYYEVIINNDQAYNEISIYISNNPKNWLVEDEKCRG